MPKGCVWGLFDKDGKKDVFGTLNLLTPDVVKEAFEEAKDGISISLKCVLSHRSPSFEGTLKIDHNLSSSWPLGAIKSPGFARKPTEHRVLAFMESPFPCHAFDDEVSFNTQTSSQWDSLGKLFS